jgi:hypothetical protein
MRKAADLERDITCAAEALDRVVEFLTRYDRLQAALMASANGGTPSPLTHRAEEGLAAARRALADIREVLPDRVLANPGGYLHGDPGE